MHLGTEGKLSHTSDSQQQLVISANCIFELEYQMLAQ